MATVVRAMVSERFICILLGYNLDEPWFVLFKVNAFGIYHQEVFSFSCRTSRAGLSSSGVFTGKNLDDGPSRATRK